MYATSSIRSSAVRDEDDMRDGRHPRAPGAGGGDGTSGDESRGGVGVGTSGGTGPVAGTFNHSARPPGGPSPSSKYAFPTTNTYPRSSHEGAAPGPLPVPTAAHPPSPSRYRTPASPPPSNGVAGASHSPHDPARYYSPAAAATGSRDGTAPLRWSEAPRATYPDSQVSPPRPDYGTPTSNVRSPPLRATHLEVLPQHTSPASRYSGSPPTHHDVGVNGRSSGVAQERPSSPKKPSRSSNPMSMANILSDSNPSEPAPPKHASPARAPSPPRPQAARTEYEAQPASTGRDSAIRESLSKVPHDRVEEQTNGQLPKPAQAVSKGTSNVKESSTRQRRSSGKTASRRRDKSRPSDGANNAMSHGYKGASDENLLPNGSGTVSKAAKRASPPKKALLPEVPFTIDESQLSDLETSGGFEFEKSKFLNRCRKRTLNVEEAEMKKRKRRRLALAEKLAFQLGRQAESGEARFRTQYARDAVAEAQQQEISLEKERKKDMQRKRRRERTMQTEYQKRKEAMEKAEQAQDEEERIKFVKEAERAEKKAKQTKLILQFGGPAEEKKGSPLSQVGSKEFRESTPLAPNMDGGSMNSFSAAKDQQTDTTPKKRTNRGGARPRKSKEQKQAEKDAAEAAHAAMEETAAGGGASKKVHDHKPSARGRDRESKLARDSLDVASPARNFTPYVSKGYNQIYDQIWRDIARKDIPRVYRIKESSMSIKQTNLRKTVQLASKEARRWQLRTNKSMKDVQSRAKRTMREMMSFWKRNEREERDMRRMAEKQELELAKKAEADREANRQKRKLNFLISQTELYSHFIGHKIKTDQVERSTDDVSTAKPAAAEAPKSEGQAAITAMDMARESGAKVTDFENLDFDDDDESKLQAIARANAQNAVQEAQDRARAFNTDAAPQPEASFDDEGEMNFQNPTSLVDMDIAQPKMLTTQLKEYQLKGLNWLVNLYEQGINGILADEMGLGKTIQSISVMGYLAENHNIWGPFLVIAPASTLHNWQQEISRFVPNLKVLPYWGNAKDRKVLRKFWDRKHITYTKDSPFHVLVTSYQLVVQDTQYFQKVRWQYMILDEAQAIKSSQSSRWKSLLGFHCRNRLLLTGTPIQNNMQELWALLHFIMPTLFDSHDEFSDWFSKDIESHAQSNTKLNEDQLKRLHMILRPFMLRRVKAHVQKELGDKIEKDVYCDLTYRQRAYYNGLRNRISIMDLIEKAAVGDDQDTATLMNLVMQFRKVCNHPDLFERAETTSPLSVAHFAETASFLREGSMVNVGYSTRNLIELPLPKLITRQGGRLDMPGQDNIQAGWRKRFLQSVFSIWTPENIVRNMDDSQAFSWLRFVDASAGEVNKMAHENVFSRALDLHKKEQNHPSQFKVLYDDDDNEKENYVPKSSMLRICDYNARQPLADVTDGRMRELLNVSRSVFGESGLGRIEQCARPGASAPPVEIWSSSQGTEIEKSNTMFNSGVRKILFGPSELDEERLVTSKTDPATYPSPALLPPPLSEKTRFTNIRVPSMQRFVTDSGKLARLDALLHELKNGGHRVLLYFQMTKMIDLMEEYLTYRNFKYLRLDGSTKLEDRRDTVHDFQTRSDIFVFLLSTRAGGLGINLTSADTVIFYDSDWNPTIDSQAMDRAHRLGQTRQVTVYRMITRGTIEERIRKRALQKEEVQRVVISGESRAGVDFNTRSKENRTKDIALWLADDDQAAEIERKEAEIAAQEARGEPATGAGKKRKGKKKTDISLDEMYHEGEGHFDDGSNKPSGAATPVDAEGALGEKSGGPGGGPGGSKKKGRKKGRTAKERVQQDG